MSFDVNPLGVQMHLKQLEREVKEQHLFERAGEDENHRNPGETVSRKGWIAWLAETFAPARLAG